MKTVITIRIDPALWDQIKKEATKQDRSGSSFMIHAAKKQLSAPKAKTESV